MDLQMVFDILLGLVAFLGGWVMNNLRDSMKSLTKADISLTNKLQEIEVLVVGQYVKRGEMAEFSKAIFDKLDRIEAKIDRKADK